MVRMVLHTQASHQNQEKWLGFNGRLWRHTIGRISNAVRVPIHFIAAIFQGGKVVVKAGMFSVQYSLKRAHSMLKSDSHPYQGGLFLRELAIDCIGLTGLLRSTVVCFNNTCFAPSARSHSFRKGITGTWYVLKGHLHQYPEGANVSDLFHLVLQGKKG